MIDDYLLRNDYEKYNYDVKLQPKEYYRFWRLLQTTVNAGEKSHQFTCRAFDMWGVLRTNFTPEEAKQQLDEARAAQQQMKAEITKEKIEKAKEEELPTDTVSVLKRLLEEKWKEYDKILGDLTDKIDAVKDKLGEVQDQLPDQEDVDFVYGDEDNVED